MKRSLLEANYGSSDEYDPEEQGEVGNAGRTESSTKLKSLPVLSKTLTPSAPIDNPALHQGRRRTQPHVDGQFVAHVYIPVRLGGKLKLVLGDLLNRVVGAIPAVYPLFDKSQSKLHISLSRPVYLRAHQRDDFKREVKKIIQSVTTFDASIARLATFVNDENTRAFLSMEVGAGHEKLKEIVDALTPHIRSLRQQPYYEAPRFHISIAWALLKPQNHVVQESDGGTDNAISNASEFPSIFEFPSELLQEMEMEFGRNIRSAGRFAVDVVEVKIGKAVSIFRLLP
ncbi:poly(U)-specific 3'-to-5' RNA exonuclease [Tulasnella sp. 403]|nr:poly(U)-specific 3'-to-5' RNA exonuclease [Tulasnella sp. 403]